METIYYSLDAKRLTICADAQGCRASGGTESVCYAFVPRRVSTQRPAQAKVVNIADYRGAGKTSAAEEREAPSSPEAPLPRRRGLSFGLMLDLAVSAAILGVLAAVLVRFCAL